MTLFISERIEHAIVTDITVNFVALCIKAAESEDAVARQSSK